MSLCLLGFLCPLFVWFAIRIMTKEDWQRLVSLFWLLGQNSDRDGRWQECPLSYKCEIHSRMMWFASVEALKQTSYEAWFGWVPLAEVFNGRSAPWHGRTALFVVERFGTPRQWWASPWACSRNGPQMSTWPSRLCLRLIRAFRYVSLQSTGAVERRTRQLAVSSGLLGTWNRLRCENVWDGVWVPMA